MSLHSKSRVLLAVFGLSIIANVLVSVWCIHIYVAEATRRFQVLMFSARDSEDVRRLLEELAVELRNRETRDHSIHDERYRHLAEKIVRRIDGLKQGESTGDLRRNHAELEKLGQRLVQECRRFVELLDADRRADAHALLVGPITEDCIDPLHQLLTEHARHTDQALTQSSVGIDSKQREVTLILCVNAGAAFLLAAIGVHLLRNWVLKPVDALKEAVEIHARGELDYRVSVQSDDELGMLARAVNDSAESLRNIQERLVQQERLAAIGEVAASIAHNIRNPLASIRANAQSALAEPGHDPARRERLEQMIATVDSLSRWLRELLMVNRPIELSHTTVNVDEIIERVIDVVTPTARRHDIDVRFTEGAGARLHVDAPRIEQALLAIVENAIEASPPHTQVTIAALNANGNPNWIELAVRDRGSGISAEIMASTQHPYFSTKPGGTGIGVHLARRIAQAHGGDLAFHNGVPGGTIVTLRLPAADGNNGGGPSGSSPAGR